jgi:hypothetical protein
MAVKELERLLLNLQRAVSDRQKALDRRDQKGYRATCTSVEALVEQIRKHVTNLERDARRTGRS